MNNEEILQMTKYMQTIKHLFVEGNIRLYADDGVILVKYEIPLANTRIRKTVHNIGELSDFCFNTYYLHEWDWKTKLRGEDICFLLNLKPSWFEKLIHRILRKLNRYKWYLWDDMKI